MVEEELDLQAIQLMQETKGIEREVGKEYSDMFSLEKDWETYIRLRGHVLNKMYRNISKTIHDRHARPYIECTLRTLSGFEKSLELTRINDVKDEELKRRIKKEVLMWYSEAESIKKEIEPWV